ncbi:MAG: Asp-tRNA(Asn)/Glu-tRNA(Gln) amidotransferase subunit GatB, partial [Anaerolineae bacterium]
MDFETVIGMEAHVQLLTRSKMFCDCAVPLFDAPPNTFTCPVCLGLPGSLPTINQRALELAGLAALALNCRIGAHVKFDRKNYHYPDLPKGYQISQYDLPLAKDGWLDVGPGGESRRIRIRRVHLEEDTAKLFHRDGRDDGGSPRSLVDFNRSGVPLIEIVTEPDLRSPAEARAYVEKIRQILRWLEVSSGDMEKGSIRLEPNISIRPAGSEELGTRTEIKNLNSFHTLELFLTKEAKRQRDVLQSGGQVQQETLGWDEAHEEILVQRTKEFPDDYRYFPEPDLPRLAFSEDWGQG